jgi:SAM-dependent methyltransferase
MSNANEQLHALALAADEHARQQHGQRISTDDADAIDCVDQILDRERSGADAQRIDSLTLCYGAWWGEWVRRQFGGQWCGLCEPTPPRIRSGGSIYSPMDAVRRRLLRETAATLRAMAEELHRSTPPANDDPLAANRAAWDARADDPRFTLTGGLTLSREAAEASVDPWLLDEGALEGRRVLCLAAGGGTHGPLHALAGARVTVVDSSPKQLECDRRIAEQMGLSIKRIVSSMDELSMFPDHAFDAVIHPVSLCYVPRVAPVYQAVARVLRSGGLYISQQKQPGSLQASLTPSGGGYVVESPADEGFALPPTDHETTLRERGTHEFLHPLESLLGALCQNGFVIEDVLEPPRGDAWAPVGSPEHRARFLAPYIKIKARRN